MRGELWMLSTLFVRGQGLLLRPWKSKTSRWRIATSQCLERAMISSTSTEQGGSFKDKTVAQVLEESIRRLSDDDAPEPVESTVHLLSASLGLSWETGYRELQKLISFPNQSNSLSKRLLNDEESMLYQDYLERRKKHEPIQYILGKWDFMDYRITIRPPLLCPRPETEELVDLVLTNHNTSGQLRILDIGCGTGCIGIALADKMGQSEVYAIDVNPIAIETTQENARKILGAANIDRFHAELIAVQDYAPDQQFDVVVSNPPYIPSSDMNRLEATVAKYESHEALDGGHDGMDIIRVILANLRDWLDMGGSCWMEVDPSHPGALVEVVDKIPGLNFDRSFKDMNGKDRFVRIKRVS